MCPGKPIHPPVRYIKLGRGGAWAEQALRSGILPLGYSQVPHELALRADKAAIADHLFATAGRSPGKAASFAREIIEFYQLGADAIWITFADGHLWWARAQPDVTATNAPRGEAQRFRRVIGAWSRTDAHGRPLREENLSTRLTKVAAYRQTVCKVESTDYLLRKLAGEEEPIVRAATEARAKLLSSAEEMIAALHWADFETFADLILARGGWHRVSALGGTMRDADLVVEQPVTGETALVQVKSAASQAVLDDYVARYDSSGSWTRLIFVCHTPRGPLDTRDRPDVIVWARRPLAEIAVRTGLFDWLVERMA